MKDFQAFAMAMKSNNTSRKAARWAQALAEFDYTIEHRSASKMKPVDSLSRNVMVIRVDEGVVSRIRLAQKNDETLKPIFQLLSNGKKYDKYLVRGDVLFKESEVGV
jgi:hypothetical protein